MPSHLSTRPTCSHLSLFNTYYLLHKSSFILPSGANATHSLYFYDALHYSSLDISLYFLISGLSFQLLNYKVSEGRSTFYVLLYQKHWAAEHATWRGGVKGVKCTNKELWLASNFSDVKNYWVVAFSTKANRMPLLDQDFHIFPSAPSSLRQKEVSASSQQRKDSVRLQCSSMHFHASESYLGKGREKGFQKFPQAGEINQNSTNRPY